MRDIAPSNDLRKWYRHDPARWDEFHRRYWDELKEKEDLMNLLREKSRAGTITFVFASRDTEHIGALALKEYIERVPADVSPGRE